VDINGEDRMSPTSSPGHFTVMLDRRIENVVGGQLTAASFPRTWFNITEPCRTMYVFLVDHTYTITIDIGDYAVDDLCAELKAKLVHETGGDFIVKYDARSMRMRITLNASNDPFTVLASTDPLLQNMIGMRYEDVVATVTDVTADLYMPYAYDGAANLHDLYVACSQLWEPDCFSSTAELLSGTIARIPIPYGPQVNDVVVWEPEAAQMWAFSYNAPRYIDELTFLFYARVRMPGGTSALYEVDFQGIYPSVKVALQVLPG